MKGSVMSINQKAYWSYKNIAKGKYTKSLENAYISGMTKDNILKLFVHTNTFAYLEKIQKELNKKWTKLETIYKSVMDEETMNLYFQELMSTPTAKNDDIDNDKQIKM